MIGGVDYIEATFLDCCRGWEMIFGEGLDDAEWFAGLKSQLMLLQLMSE